MIGRTILAVPGVIVSLMLLTAPAFADLVTDTKDRVTQSQQRRTHHARWDRYRHPKVTGGMARTDAAGATDDTDVATDNGVTAPLDRQSIESGFASWYGLRHQGRKTSSGRLFNQNELTAAHPWLPLGSRVRVRLVGTSRSVEVTITDRPGTRRRIIDLSREAARQLGMVYRGTALVTLSHL
jgi:rare lipoprotein A (peptidoglycan hydrolase)